MEFKNGKKLICKLEYSADTIVKTSVTVTAKHVKYRPTISTRPEPLYVEAIEDTFDFGLIGHNAKIVENPFNLTTKDFYVHNLAITSDYESDDEPDEYFGNIDVTITNKYPYKSYDCDYFIEIAINEYVIGTAPLRLFGKMLEKTGKTYIEDSYDFKPSEEEYNAMFECFSYLSNRFHRRSIKPVIVTMTLYEMEYFPEEEEDDEE